MYQYVSSSYTQKPKHEYTDVLTYYYTSITYIKRTHSSTNIPEHLHTIQFYQCVNIVITNVLTYKYTNLPVYYYTHILCC